MGKKKTVDQQLERVTGKRLLTIYLCFFLVFGLVGYIRGKVAQHDPTYLRYVIKKENLIEAQRDKNGIHLIYSCPRLPYRYSIDTDQIDKLRSLEPSERDEALSALFKDTTVLSAFLGGATAWTVKDLFSYIAIGGGSPVASRIKMALAAVVGAVSGYYVGFYLAVEQQPPCDSELFEPVLQDKETWVRLRSALWEANLRSTENRFHWLEGFRLPNGEERQTQDQLWKESAVKFNQLMEKSESYSYHITTADFDVLSSVNESLTQYLELYKSKQGNIDANTQRKP